MFVNFYLGVKIFIGLAPDLISAETFVTNNPLQTTHSSLSLVDLEYSMAAPLLILFVFGLI